MFHLPLEKIIHFILEFLPYQELILFTIYLFQKIHLDLTDHNDERNIRIRLLACERVHCPH